MGSLWTRGIISKCHHHHNLCPEIYLIDFQRFIDKGNMFELRTCPPKFLQLILPTYYIDIDLCLNDDDLKIAITILMKKNQYGELSFSFIPHSFENNVYSGILIVNYKVNNLNIPLKKLLKNIHTKKIFAEIPQYKNQVYSIFNPIKLKYLKKIFIPREPNDKVFLKNNLVLSCCDLSVLSDSNTNLSYNSINEFSSNSNYSENICFSDDSELEIKKLENICVTPLSKQKVYSSNSSLMSKSSSSLQSITSINNNNNNNCSMPQIKQCNNSIVTRMPKLKDTRCQENNKPTLTLEVLETPKIQLKSITDIKAMNTTMENSDIWWSDDDES
ncbi:kinesin-related protein 2-like isoform X2 [Rhopalosiphum maidis]|nr:kinesin-related protein 2-like isoform X2 [Rhopalosiphum maidis]